MLSDARYRTRFPRNSHEWRELARENPECRLMSLKVARLIGRGGLPRDSAVAQLHSGRRCPQAGQGPQPRVIQAIVRSARGLTRRAQRHGKRRIRRHPHRNKRAARSAA
jgi:hypothetical protein